MKPLTILLCSLIVLQISAQTFDAVLALSWPAGHCEYLEGLNKGRHCDPKLLKPWNNRRFTIHGLWAQARSNQDFGKFDVNAVKPLLNQLNLYWPARSEASANPTRPTFDEQYWLWIHEWEKHGKDFGAGYISLSNGAGLSSNIPTKNLQIQRLFFSETLRLYKKYQAQGRGLSALPATRSALAAALKVPDNSLIIRCLPSQNIQEIRICLQFSFDNKTKKIIEKEVACRSGNNCRTQRIQLKEFK